MNNYQVINQPMSFPAGIEFKLSADQVRRRSHSVIEVRDGVYRSTEAIMFKVGEKIGLDGEPGKGLAQSLELAGEESKPAASSKPKPESKPKPGSGKEKTKSKSKTKGKAKNKARK
jgi:hypothetical protein